ncbi:MAG: O-antigen ligase family protein [Bacteroidales bacterium]|nr:O-antigen ligase family protein [Bacteroidales bacterium]
MSRFKMYKPILFFIKNDFQFYIFIIFSILLPFSKQYLPLITFAWVVSAIFSIRKVKRESFQNIILLAFPTIFYLIHILGLFYSENIGNGMFNLEKKLSILFIPLVVIFITEKIKLNYRIILKVFVLANFIAGIICLLYAFNNSIGVNELGECYFESSYLPKFNERFRFIQLINHRYSYFSYAFLSIFQHPSYFSTYILFSIIILIYLIRSSKKRQIGYYGLILYFTIFIWLLGSRAAYLTYLISLFSFFLILILKYKKYWIAVTILGVGILISIIAISNEQLNKNIKETISFVDNKPLNKDSDIRLWLWKSGFEVLKDNLWFGVGIGDADEKLKEKYIKYDLDVAQEHNYNVHNQYLDIAVKLGLVGFLVLTGWIIITLLITIKRKQFLFFYFMLILSINFFFEAMLNTIAGISFFVFFYSLLVTISIKKEKT